MKVVLSITTNMTAEEEIEAYEKKNGFKLPAHNKSILRAMIEKENKWWDEEEGRVLKDSNRYRD